MVYIVDKFSNVLSKFKYNFVKQPWKVTVNNIVKELPSISEPVEAIYSSVVKAYTVTTIKYSIAPLLGITIGDIEKDSTHVGAFVQNIVSGNKNLALWYKGIPRGTRNHTLDRVASDYFLKGGCKVGLISTKILGENQLIINTLCEGIGYVFVDAGENIYNKNASYSDLSAWKNVLSDPYHWVDATRKAASSALVAKIVIGWVIKPVEKGITKVVTTCLPALLGDLNSARIISLFTTNLQLQHLPYVGEVIAQNAYPWISNFVIIPSIANIATLIPTGMIIVPAVRVAIYTVNSALKVIVEFEGEVTCMKMGDVFALAENSAIPIEYKYDAYKTIQPNEESNYLFVIKNETIALAKNLVDTHNNLIIVHYPKEDDFVSKAEGFIGKYIGKENVDYFEAGIEHIGFVVEQVEDNIYYGFKVVEDVTYECMNSITISDSIVMGAMVTLAMSSYFLN